VYDTRVTGTETLFSENLSVETTEDTLRTRGLGEAGADVELRASRVYDVNRGGVARVAHVVEPRVNYTFIDGVNTDDLPRWDEIDAIRRTNRVAYSLTNRLVAKTAAGPDETAVKWELVRFVLANSFDVDAERRPFSNITGDLIIDPGRYVRLRADAAGSPYDAAALRSINSDISLTFAQLTATLGTRYNADSNIEYYRAEATARLGRNLALRGSSDWDPERDEFVESRIGADVLFQCWAIALTYVQRSRESEPATSRGGSSETDHEFRVNLDLLGVGTFQTSAGLGR
jgi:hypothetical protein